MAEMIIPGTYIDVRAEGLISAGGVASGILGVIGTASSGPIGVPSTVSSYSEARDLFGLPDAYSGPTSLTLTRALQFAYANGASTAVAVRVASARSAAATYALKDSGGNTVATLAALTPGTWGNDIAVSVDPAATPARIVNEKQTSGFSTLAYHRVRPDNQNRLQVLRGDTRRVDVFNLAYNTVVTGETVVKNGSGVYQLGQQPIAQVANINSVLVVDSTGKPVRAYGANPPTGVTAGTIIYNPGATPALNEVRINPATGEMQFEATQAPSAGQTVVATYCTTHADPAPGEVLITAWDGTIDFHTGEAPRAASGDVLTANYLVEAADSVQITLTWGQTKEVYVVPDGKTLASLSGTSSLITAAADATHGGNKPATGVSGFFGTGSNVGGANGEDAGQDEYSNGLDAISNMLVNVVLLAGQDASMASVLLGHLADTEGTDHERVGVIGAPGSKVSDFLGHMVADGRVVLVAPGIQNDDGSTLPTAYTAACIAGLICSFPVQTSLTNKTVNVPGIAVNTNRGQQEQLIERNVLTVVAKDAYRVLKGVTTEGVGEPFSAIPTRRIVDYAKYGVRAAANPYIGRLNNSRVRAALKATLDAFLTGMVQDEALTGYTLDVTATRAQEIQGIVSVIMNIQPTFSIDYIRVVMTLQ